MGGDICIIRYILKLALFSAILHKQALAVLQFTQAPSDQAAILGQALWWHCVARASIGSQDPTYSWRYNGALVVSGGGEGEPSVFSNGTLYIASITQDVLGSYQCQVQSGVQMLDSDTVTLALASLDFSFLTSPESTSQNLGSSLSLQCSINSVPMATVAWQLNREDLSAPADIFTSESGGVTTSSLRVDALEHIHGGQYRCLATNKLLIGLTRYSQAGDVTLIGRPGFSVTPSPITVIVGLTATFMCEGSDNPASTVDWLNSQDTVITTNGRFTATPTRLTITNTQLTDEGYYTCRATNGWGVNTATALLTVTDLSQQIVFTATPSDQSQVAGGRVTFPCGASGNPTPVISWEKEGGSLPIMRIQQPAEGWLRITGLETSDSGFYVCTASNSVSIITTRVQLIVQVAPSFAVAPDDSIVEAGNAAVFECAPDGIPTPDITWNTPLPELGPLGISSGQRSGVEVRANGSLVIPNAENRHAGTYICLATNSVASSSTSATLTVKSAPVITTSPTDVTAIEGASARFECRAVATPAPTLAWFFGGNPLLTDLTHEVLGNGELRIINVEAAQEGVYTCTTQNYLGVTNASAYLTVYVPPQFIVHPSDLIVDLGSEVKLDCAASGDPLPTIHWQKDGQPLILETNIEVLSNSSILISDLTETNTGEYTCTATNIAGSNQVTARVETPDIPEFIIPPSNATGNQTYPISLQCQAKARESPIISWYLSDVTGSRGDRIRQGISLPGTPAEGSFVALSGDLEIGSVSEIDEGWYLCLAENTVGSVSGLMYLSVNVAPRILTTNTPVQTVEASSYALLSCDVIGQPTPSTSWLLPNGEPVPTIPALYSASRQGDTAFLVVYSPSVAEHAGDFVCTNTNFLGSVNATVQLIVEGVPVISSVEASSTDPSSITLRCNTKGLPSPSITWQRDSTDLPNPTVITGHTVESDGTLVITDLGAAETGVYACRAENTYGSANATLRAPNVVSTPSVTVVTPTSISLSWDQPLTWSDLLTASYVVQYQADGSSEYVEAGETGDPFYEVVGLQPYTEYRLRVAAVNGLGRGLFSEPTSLTSTSAAAPSIPQNVEASASGNLLTVTWTEPASLNGMPEDILYEVVYHPVGAESEQASILVNQPTAILSDLEFLTEYEVKVRAGNSELEGEWSDYVIVEASTGYQAPQLPIENFRAVANSSSTIWLTWQPTDDLTFEAYLISFRVANSSDTSPDVVLPARGAGSYLIVGLQGGVAYGVRLAYQNAGGLSPFTQETLVTTHSGITETGSNTGSSVDGGIIAAIVIGIVAVILILAFLALFLHWKRKNDAWTGQPQSPFNADSMWINRRGGSQKGVYDLSVVNENFSPNETGLSSDSAYDLGGGGAGGRGGSGRDLTEVSPRSDTLSDGEEKKKKKRKWRGLSDVIYKNPDNPGVVLVSKAIIGDTYPPPVQVNKDEVLSDDEADTTIPSPLSMPIDPPDTPISSPLPQAQENEYVEMGNESTLAVNGASPQGLEFPVFPNADDSPKLSPDFGLDPRLMRKMERRAERDQEKRNRRREKEEEKERKREEKETERMFGGRKMSAGLPKIFKRKKSDEIPYPELNFAVSNDRQVENAGMF